MVRNQRRTGTSEFRVSRIACWLNGGIGDELLALPAVHYLVHELRSHQIELRLGGWRGRAGLFRTMLDDAIPVCSTTTIGKATSLYRGILDFDQRDVPHVDFDRFLTPRGVYVRATEFHAAGRPHWESCFAAARDAVTRIRRTAASDDDSQRFRTTLPRTPSDSLAERLEHLCGLAGEHRPLIAVTPGGRSPSYKRWPPERFAEVIERVANLDISVLVLGDASESDVSNSIRSRMTPRVLQSGRIAFLAGRTSLAELPYILRRVDLHLTNDNGVAHLGGLLNCRQIVLYRGTTTPHQTAGFRDARLFSNDPADMRGIAVDHVEVLIEQILRLYEALERSPLACGRSPAIRRRPARRSPGHRRSVRQRPPI